MNEKRPNCNEFAANTSLVRAVFRRIFYALWREENLHIHAQIARTCLRLLRSNGLFPITNARIADIGCGDGRWLLEFLQRGAVANDLHGLDLLPERIAAAQQRVGNSNLVLGNAARLPWRSHSFDLVTQFVVVVSLPVVGVCVHCVSSAMTDGPSSSAKRVLERIAGPFPS